MEIGEFTALFTPLYALYGLYTEIVGETRETYSGGTVVLLDGVGRPERACKDDSAVLEVRRCFSIRNEG